LPDTIPVKREEREALLSTPVGLLFHELVHSPEGLVRGLDSPRFLQIPPRFPRDYDLVHSRGWRWPLSAG